ncbi:hypothetical protein Pla108_34310 [Botrimarina colliarenosi]|uniref:Uncharacterized protein n=1 Tax=Botrimarina colliarenosi TaxID=2528001 RepID=A0A5C6A772_9BACT|nr:hypothetical protein Pla108_34310 [Botrimarina colliarenosi]
MAASLPLVLVVAAFTATVVGCGPEQSSGPLADPKHTHYHLHASDVEHEHDHQEFLAGAHTHGHDHAALDETSRQH